MGKLTLVQFETWAAFKNTVICMHVGVTMWLTSIGIPAPGTQAFDVKRMISDLNICSLFGALCISHCTYKIHKHINEDSISDALIVQVYILFSELLVFC